jgi:hypothetical protein
MKPFGPMPPVDPDPLLKMFLILGLTFFAPLISLIVLNLFIALFKITF